MLTNGAITVKTEVPPVKVIKDYPTEAETEKTFKKIEAQSPELAKIFRKLEESMTERDKNL